jgi:energy-coupling factor transport system permease protein
MTTPLEDLAFGITRLGFNYKTAYIITSAFNILPSFQEDTRQLLDARKLRRFAPASPRSVMSRGKNVFTRFGEYAKIALPLIIKTMRRASAAGLAMDARAFGAYRARTWRRKTGMKAADFTALASALVYAAVAVTANYIIK